MFPVIKQLEERNVANEINILLWSHGMDLIAYSNVKGDVALHRLTWARVWNLDPPKENVTVTAMAWRPDGKVLAVAYSSGEVLLVNVENKQIIHKFEIIETDVSSVFWIREKLTQPNSNSILLMESEKSNDYMKHIDHSSKYLPDLPPLSSLSPSVANSQDDSQNSYLFDDQKELNLLIIGGENGCLYISVFGHFPCTVLDLSKQLGCQCSIVSVQASDDLSCLYVTVLAEDRKLRIAIIHTTIFKTHIKELFAIAMKHGRLTNLIQYLANVIIPIKETWETILLEMDAKLSSYASKVPEGRVTSDFMDLLMFGVKTDELEYFLLQDLSEKGFRKFGKLIEIYYTNIQVLLLKHVTKAGEDITFHLSELDGMARLLHRYKVLGLSETTITDAIRSTGAFLTKVGEMHQIINDFQTNYMAFFRWVYIAILTLLHQPILMDMSGNTQSDIAHIMEFMENFDNISSSPEGGKPKRFTMERLGQYLNDAPLTIPPKLDDNLWEKFLAENECIRNDPGVIKRFKGYSLIQQFNHLKGSIADVFEVPKGMIVQQFAVQAVISCFNPVDASHMTSINRGDESSLFVFLNNSKPAAGLTFLNITTNNGQCRGTSAYFYFKPNSNSNSDKSENFHILDVQFYSTNILSVLLQETNPNRHGTLYQFQVNSAIDKLQNVNLRVDLRSQRVPQINAFDLGPAVTKNLDGMVCSALAVSGSRRVSVVLSENRRKVRLFEMEAEEDEEEDADMTNSARESDTSMQEDSSANE